MWNALGLLFRQLNLTLYLSSKLSFYINVFHMFLTCFISIWSLFTENNLCRCITYFLLQNRHKIRNIQNIFLEYFNTNYLDMCPVPCFVWVPLPYYQILIAFASFSVVSDWFYFVFFFYIDKIWWRFREVLSMNISFVVWSKKSSMKHIVYVPLNWKCSLYVTGPRTSEILKGPSCKESIFGNLCPLLRCCPSNHTQSPLLKGCSSCRHNHLCASRRVLLGSFNLSLPC